MELSRRTLFSLAGGLGAAGLLGYSVAVTREQSSEPTTITGTVLSLDGTPVTDASVVAFGPEPTSSFSALTGSDGRFTLTTGRNPVWVRTTHEDFLPQTRAVAPGEEIRVELTPRRGENGSPTVSLGFGGDVMFGRRFYRSDTDPLSSSYRLAASDRQDSHRRLLAPISPLLQTADITAVNLETPLSTAPWRHPDKQFTYTSHPVAAAALDWAGVDYVSLGNNHTFDLLTPGLEETITAVESAGLSHSGAGFSPDAAWEPAVSTHDDVSIAYISCTTVAGQQYDFDWSADREPAREYDVTQNGETLTVPGNVGVAEATVERLQTRVSAATATADFVVVQIHGGEEYQRRPTDEMVALTDAAIRAGAGLVVNHHPHVTGGLDVRNGTPVAWSLGNLVSRGLVDEIHAAGRYVEAFARSVDGAVTVHSSIERAASLLDTLLARDHPIILMGNTVDEFMRDLETEIRQRATETGVRDPTAPR